MTYTSSFIKIANKLFEDSGKYIEVRNDPNLQIPGFSIIEKDIHGRMIPTILINMELIPEDENIFAHILSHEWGHHVMGHIDIFSPEKQLLETRVTRQNKENEADLFAAQFIKKYSYDTDNIIAFFREHPHDLDNRIQILLSA